MHPKLIIGFLERKKLNLKIAAIIILMLIVISYSGLYFK